MKTAIDILAKGLAQHKVEALLIGGYALPAYGVMRQTVDVDCLMAETDIRALDGILSKVGYVEKEKTENFVRYSHHSLYLMDVDVVLVDRSTFKKMVKESVIYRIGKIEMRVPSLTHLIALKLHAIKNNPPWYEMEDPTMAYRVEVVKDLRGGLSSISLFQKSIVYLRTKRTLTGRRSGFLRIRASCPESAKSLTF